ncbi:hypothetical protein MHYP_G00091050 [Metynnis hypsauchen]
MIPGDSCPVEEGGCINTPCGRVGVLSRLAGLGCILRRTYSVRGPLSLWHVDTNHKLLRIERLWHDVKTCVTSKYFNMLQSLEMDQLLCVSSAGCGVFSCVHSDKGDFLLDHRGN